MNIIIVVVTAILVFGLFRRDGKWDLGRARNAFRCPKQYAVCNICTVFAAIPGCRVDILSKIHWNLCGDSNYDDGAVVPWTRFWVPVYV